MSFTEKPPEDDLYPAGAKELLSMGGFFEDLLLMGCCVYPGICGAKEGCCIHEVYL